MKEKIKEIHDSAIQRLNMRDQELQMEEALILYDVLTDLKHPKWIMDMFNVLEEIDKYLSENSKNYVESGSILHTKIKECLSNDDAS